MRKLEIISKRKESDNQFGKILKEYHSEKVKELRLGNAVIILMIILFSTMIVSSVNVAKKEFYIAMIWIVFSTIAVIGTVYDYFTHRGYNKNLLEECYFYETGFVFKKWYSNEIERVSYDSIQYIRSNYIEKSIQLGEVSSFASIHKYKVLKRYFIQTEKTEYVIYSKLNSNTFNKMMGILKQEFKIYNNQKEEQEFLTFKEGVDE